MKQLFNVSNNLSRNYCKFQGSVREMKLSKVLFFCCLVVFAFAGSSFKKEIRHSSDEKKSTVEKTVPFKGSLAVSLNGAGFAGAGVGSHIGRFEYSSVDDFSSFPVVTGTATIIAANGDEIYTSFSGLLTPIGEGLFSVTIENMITGGTGRFEGATGSYTSTGTANIVAGTANTTFTGSITY